MSCPAEGLTLGSSLGSPLASGLARLHTGLATELCSDAKSGAPLTQRAHPGPPDGRPGAGGGLVASPDQVVARPTRRIDQAFPCCVELLHPLCRILQVGVPVGVTPPGAPFVRRLDGEHAGANAKSESCVVVDEGPLHRAPLARTRS